MAAREDIAEIADMIRRLRAADSRRRVFGSQNHRYRLGRKLSEEELAKFEAIHGIQLPEDYRCFLALVGNGGAGPYYGLEPLDSFGRDRSKPFPYTRATDQLTEAESKRSPDVYSLPGILEFCHQGCDIYSYLVVNGPTYGTIWNGREDLYPSGLCFGAWYRERLERILRWRE